LHSVSYDADIMLRMIGLFAY